MEFNLLSHQAKVTSEQQFVPQDLVILNEEATFKMD